MADRTGQQLGHYRLVRLLGRGGFAEVYLGEHLRLKTHAAIKVLYTALEEDDIESFLREAQTVARLKHPHIVRVFDFDVQDHTPYLVMDYLPNGSIRRLYPRGTVLPLSAIVSSVTQIASALQYAHDEKVIHRDIKPENMLLDRDNSLVLSDFGIALMTQSSHYQSAQEVTGTAAYMAPEQFQGHPHRASDQYALGIVVYEWLSGDRPFHGTFSEIASQHLFVLPAPLREKVPTISTEVEEVVLTALAKDPKQRFGSMLAFATALEQACQPAPSHQTALASEVLPVSEPSLPSETIATVLPTQLPQSPTIVTPPSQSLQPTEMVIPAIPLSQPTSAATPIHTPAVSPTSTEEPISSSVSQPSRHHISRRAMVVGLVGLTVAGGGLTWLALSQKSQVSLPRSIATSVPSPTPTLTPIALGTNLFTYRSSGRVYAVTWSPNGKRIAFGGSEAGVLDAATGTVLFSYHGHSTDGLLAVAWSPDGTRIASAGFDKTVQVWDAATGNHIYTYRGHSSEVFAVAWSPDSTRIASGGGPNSDNAPTSDTTVQVWDAATGNHIYTYRGHSQIVLAVAWSPNGKRIASAEGDGTGTVQVWDAVNGGYGGNLLVYRGHSIRVDDVAWSPDSSYIASASWDQTVQVCDATTGNRNFTYQSNKQEYTVAWSPDGKRIASGGGSESTSGGGMPVQVWDAFTGKHILTYGGHSCACYGGVYTVAWSPDGKRIASGGEDQTVQVWHAG